MLRLNGQNLRLAAKNGLDSKTPAPHLSATRGRETAGRLTASLLPTSPGPDSRRPPRRPPKLAPLELPEAVRESQRRKLQLIQQEAKPASCQLDATGADTCAGEVKSCVGRKPEKAAGRPAASAERHAPSRPRPARSVPAEHNGDELLEDAVRRGAPAPLGSRPAPPLLAHRAGARAPRPVEVAREIPQRPPAGEKARRWLRPRRSQGPGEDKCNSLTSTGGLSADKGELAQGVQGEGKKAERAGKAIREPPAAHRERGGRIRESHQEDCRQPCAPTGQTKVGAVNIRSTVRSRVLLIVD
uniref:translation initiation factor IF-2 n=1 Tax=Gasterosteus aculeatus aculeatus TaxID=481459 RepID=UPI001A98572A|nr:translation initiation factor IF-2 [Gasterosteus aculeatus aculeatus]